MIDLDPAKLPSEITNSLLRRGMALPPVEWASREDPMAKKALDEIDDLKLLGVEHLKDEGMAAAVRALLYLWHGCLDDCRMHTSLAPPKERSYITGLCDRHAGKPVEAKADFQELGGHEIHADLFSFAEKQIMDGGEPALDRFLGILKLGGEWEAFAFIDLYEQGRAGKLQTNGQHAVQLLQCKEFELLFEHCFLAAGGEKAVRREEIPDQVKRVRRIQQQNREPEQRHNKRAEKSSQAKVEDIAGKWSTGGKISIRCPSCQKLAIIPETSRGLKVKCDGCAAQFVVPKKSDAAA